MHIRACLTVVLLVAHTTLAIVPTQDISFDCVSMEPHNMDTRPEKLPSPFFIYIVKLGKYSANQEVRVNLNATRHQKFSRYFVKAHRLDPELNNKEPIGYWVAENDAAATEVCDERFAYGSALVSSPHEARDHVELIWTAPTSAQGHLQFRASFVHENGETYWVREKSEMLRDPLEPLTFQPPPPRQPPPIRPILTAPCGVDKGCYRVPAGCTEYQCEYLFTWQDKKDVIEFEIGGQQDGFDDRWVAAALSTDIRMGDDAVMACVHDSETGKVGVVLSYNEEEKENAELPNPEVGITFQEGSYYNGRLRCRFRRDKYIGNDHRLFPLTGDAYHILMARGGAYQSKIRRHRLVVGKFPVASPSRVIFQSVEDVSGRARYPLVKAHACLMLFAWVFCATIGMVMVKYYKKMWPNERFYGEKYWVVVHRSCMVMVFFAVVIAFILIFIEADGYSKAPDLPPRAHPILGIIITVCVVINPIIALLRPNEENRYRPVFNWIHFIFGLIAVILAMPNLFIGMDFGKAHVPYWATWILCFYMLFHLIVEVMLEVHQCCTHKKNKERRKKWEYQKMESPKLHHPEPDPVGHRFKRNTLFVHVLVTTIISIVLIITVAVC